MPSVATMAVFPVQLVAARPNPGVSCYAEYQRHEESVLAPGDLVEAVRRLELRLPPEPTGEEVVDSETTDIVFDVPAYWAKARMHRQPDGAWRLVRIETWRGSYDP